MNAKAVLAGPGDQVLPRVGVQDRVAQRGMVVGGTPRRLRACGARPSAGVGQREKALWGKPQGPRDRCLLGGAHSVRQRCKVGRMPRHPLADSEPSPSKKGPLPTCRGFPREACDLAWATSRRGKVRASKEHVCPWLWNQVPGKAQASLCGDSKG